MVSKLIVVALAGVVLLSEVSRSGARAETEKSQAEISGTDSGNQQTVIIENGEDFTKEIEDPEREVTKEEQEKIIVVEQQQEFDNADSSQVNQQSQPAVTQSANFVQAQADRKALEKTLTSTGSKVLGSTSLSGSAFREGKQFKRDTGFEGTSITDFAKSKGIFPTFKSTFQQTLFNEQKRAENIRNLVFGQNNNFQGLGNKLGLGSSATNDRIEQELRRLSTKSSATKKALGLTPSDFRRFGIEV